MEFRAEARFMRVSPQKARLVLDLIKGQRVEEARNTLLFTKKRVAATVGKLLQSAIDNANFLSTEKRAGRRSRQPVRQECGRQRRSAHEAHPSGADGTRVPLQRRISHIEIVLAERGKNNASVATVVGEEEAPKTPAKAKARADEACRPRRATARTRKSDEIVSSAREAGQR